ncbi:hypothetical protein ABTW72_05225 [Micromonospora sp. NPDC127501]|uniref:hypothetical protein n=1 Tax=Micromonospora sp. NPDC127501 TaxID=3154872 RepID=UPI00331DD510
MVDLDGLTNAEYLVLSPLEEDTPRPLWEIAEAFIDCVAGELPTTEQVAALLGPALASLAAHGLIEIRRFGAWPAPWEQGADVVELGTDSRCVDIWSRTRTHDVLVARITEVGTEWF